MSNFTREARVQFPVWEITFLHLLLEGGPQNSRQLNCSFTIISSHFFAIYIISFHEIEVQTVILRCWTGLYLDWFMNYDTKHKYFCFRFLPIL